MDALPPELLVKIAGYCPLPAARAFALSSKDAAEAVREAIRHTAQAVARVEELDGASLKMVQRRLSKGLCTRKRLAEAELDEDFVAARTKSRMRGNTCTAEGCRAEADDSGTVRLCAVHHRAFCCPACNHIHRWDNRAVVCTRCRARMLRSCGLFHMDAQETEHWICRACVEDLCKGAV